MGEYIRRYQGTCVIMIIVTRGSADQLISDEATTTIVVDRSLPPSRFVFDIKILRYKMITR